MSSTAQEEPSEPKLNIAIVHCTGEDESFPVSQLVRHTTATRGWHSMKLCEYPQEIILRFNGEVQLSSLRILVHETKIPSRIDLSVCRPETEEQQQSCNFPPLNSANFHRLGYLTFTNNEASNFESRELKTAALNTRAVYLKLTLRRCHANMSNVFNQVGIIALGVYGRVVNEYPQPDMTSSSSNNNNNNDVHETSGYGDHLPGSIRESLQLRLNRGAGGGGAEVPLHQLAHAAAIASSQQHEQQHSGASSNYAPTLAGATLDPTVSHVLEELATKKAKAVSDENYDEAKRIKLLIDRLRDCAMTLADLQERKRRAIEAEDYDVAKALKLQIDEVQKTVSAEIDFAGKHPATTSRASPLQHQSQGGNNNHQDHQNYHNANEASHSAAGGGNYDEQPAISLSQLQQQQQQHHHHHQQQDQYQHHQQPKNLQKQFDETPVGGHNNNNQPSEQQQQQQDEYQQHQGQQEEQESPYQQHESQSLPQPQPHPNTHYVINKNDFDEKPVGGDVNRDAKFLEETGGIITSTPSNTAPSSARASSNIQPEQAESEWEQSLIAMINSELSSEVAPPGPLPQKSLPQTLSAHVSAFGRFTTSCLISKKFQHREAAVRVLSSKQCVSLLKAKAHKDPVAHVSELLIYFNEKGHGVDDGISQVFFSVCDALKNVLTGGVDDAVSVANEQELNKNISQLIPSLLLKAGDSNQRVREHASATLMLIAMSPVGPEKLASALLHDPQQESKKPLNFRIQSARLSLATVMVSKVGLSTRSKPTGLTAEGLTKFLCVPQLTHSSGEVREAAVHLIVLLHGLVPAKQMQTYLAEVPNAQKAIIEEQLEMAKLEQQEQQNQNTSTASAAASSSSSPGRGNQQQGGDGEEPNEELKSSSISVSRPTEASEKALAAARAAAISSEAESKNSSAVPPSRLPGGKKSAPGGKTSTTATTKAAPGSKQTAAQKAVGKKASSPTVAGAGGKSKQPAAPASKTASKQKPEEKPKTQSAPAQVVAASQQQQEEEAVRGDPDPEAVEDQTCQFCGRYDSRYDDESLDRHYMRSCPMLCACPLCGQICEIALLQEHLTTECPKSEKIEVCPNCCEAVRPHVFDEHIASASCIKHNPTLYNVCPLCHEKTPPFEEGWKKHFLTSPGCGNNPRVFNGGDPDDDFKE